PIFRLLEQGQDGAEVPAGVAGRRPAVVVGPVAAGPEQGVDAPRAAQHLAERQGDGAAGDVRARLVAVGPVVARAGFLPPLRGLRGPGAPSPPPARLDQKDGGVGLHQAARHHAPRGPRADDDVVVTSGERLAVPGIAISRTHGHSLPGCDCWHPDGNHCRPLARALRHFAALMKIVWVYSSSPSRPITRPVPDCFVPPNGVSGRMSRCLFTQTVPALIRVATANARSRSDDQTEPPRPYSVSLTRAIASSRSVYRSTGKIGPNCSS